MRMIDADALHAEISAWPESIMYKDWVQSAIANAPTLTQPPITGDTSDGYHTFNELYHHRAVLFSVICNEHHDIVWKSKKHHDGTMYDGMFIVGIDTPGGQATYHYDIDPYWDLFRVKELELAPKWDGHTPGEAIRRIATLTPPNELRAGLYGKYTVLKNEDGSLVTNCFVLRPEKDPAAVAALRAYAAATDNAELAADITNWVGAEPSEWVKVMEAINNAAVAYIEGGPYENDLPGMEFALKIDRLSRDFVRPPEGEEKYDA